ncbi:MAG: serine hydrolase [Candidatus Kerfeldbacteria bacterium]|nr:serine hydrolase [Candidatus Kerfeldbacteria bacterium]
MKRYSFLLTLSIVTFFLGIGFDAHALAAEERVRFSAEAMLRGYTADFRQTTHPTWGDLRVGILPDLVNEQIDLYMKEFDGSKFPDPAGMVRVSDYFIYDILRQDQSSKEPLKLNKPFYLALRFNSGNLWRKRIFFWTGTAEGWRPLPSNIDYTNGYVRAITHLPFSRIAVFEDHNGTEGYASWYRSSRYPYGAASNDFPIGTKLRVRNVNNGKIVDVEVVSTGPFTPFSERRVIDLSLTAFQQIEESWKGTAKVQVWRIDAGVVLGAETKAVAEPNIASTAAIALSRNTGAILYSKNYDKQLPLASITKLMTALVFLDTHTSFDTLVTYASSDDAAGARLSITPGEQLRVKDLWFTMLVGSANNAANALARASGLSRELFVQKMNLKAQQLGLAKTKFVDVTGLDLGNTSTVYDIAQLAKHAFGKWDILQATTTWSYGFITSTGTPHTIKNTAKGMQGSSLVITGMKTGYLDEAGYCFVTKASSARGAPEVISVVLGAASDVQRWAETNALLQYGLNLI